MTSWSRRIAKPTIPSSKGLRQIIQKAGYVAVPYKDCLALDPELRQSERAMVVGARLHRAGLTAEYGMPQTSAVEDGPLRFWWPEWRWDGSRDTVAGDAVRAKDAAVPGGVQSYVAEVFQPEMRRFLQPLPVEFLESMGAEGAAMLTSMGLVIMISHSEKLGWMMSCKTKEGANSDDPRIFALLTTGRDRWDRVGAGYWISPHVPTPETACDPRGN